MSAIIFVISIILLFIPSKYTLINWPTSLAFVFGAICALFAGNIWMDAATMSNAKVVKIAQHFPEKAAGLGMKARHWITQRIVSRRASSSTSYPKHTRQR
ncbi:MAG: hypothetical protein ACTSVI_16065 [Promethearchaeota archaeon]